MRKKSAPDSKAILEDKPRHPLDTPSEAEAELVAEAAGEEVVPTPPPTQQLPLSVALLSETRRVREQVLPAWYHQRYGPAGGDPNASAYITTINAALTTADQAMMNQDLGQMLFAYQALTTYQVQARDENLG